MTKPSTEREAQIREFKFVRTLAGTEAALVDALRLLDEARAEIARLQEQYVQLTRTLSDVWLGREQAMPDAPMPLSYDDIPSQPTSEAGLPSSPETDGRLCGPEQGVIRDAP